MNAILALEDGTVLRGRSCGAPGSACGEMVFNTSMTGYQEVLTDPSYKGQVVMMTYPLIGNYGITAADHESKKPRLEAFVVRELCRRPSNWESVETVEAFLRRNGIPAIERVDTRALTLRLREKGSLRCVVSTADDDARRLVRKARAAPSMAGADLAKLVTCARPFEWDEPLLAPVDGRPVVPGWPLRFPRPPRVAVLDFGVKAGILRCLVSMGCRVSVAPAQTAAADLLALAPDGILLSNGPGDPEPVVDAIETIRALLAERIPMFGICLGHQLLGLALGGKTFKLKFGHHGANHPVKDLATGRIEVTTQNHGFCVDLKSLPDEVRTTHVNLNDGTSEGMEHARLPVFSVQYHPESCAGPHDSRYLFTRFGERMLAGVTRERLIAADGSAGGDDA
ncbi:MAG: glutamine-hydrolyzing carbamoyl-phosphate synthase small subunit [Elusimicrobia bacterium]|nr:glutamine-hydrolyzing carbamoyl-phosphate synthase small subunit [Elusimicrobiota bacterium]